MLRRLQASLAIGVCVAAVPAMAQEPDEATPEESPPDTTGPELDALGEPGPEEPPVAEEPVDEPTRAAQPSEPADTTAAAPEEPAKAAPEKEQTADAGVEPPAPKEGPTSGWSTEIHGYFRAPFALGISSRPNPETLDTTTNTFTGEQHTQISYGPTRTIDADYYSFGYTRLQEQDWAEVLIHVKKKHVHAAVGWMGYWYQGAGFRNPDAAWAPGLAYLTLDTDLSDEPNASNIALTAGAFWPAFGTFEKYDTYTLGRFRHIGEQLKFRMPLTDELAVTLTQGFGTSRDGSFNPSAPAPFQGQVILDLLHYENISVSYDKHLEVGLHYNKQWTRDPFTEGTGVPGKQYSDKREAHLTVVGGEASVFVPYAGRLWVSPSFVHVRNGWALDGWAGTELMHSIGGKGIAVNYMAERINNVAESTGTGSMRNVGWLYENTLSNIQGEEPGGTPEVTLNVFGLFADITLDLPETSTLPQDRMGQLKYGADLEFQALDWLGVMVRYDEVNYNIDHPGYVFSAITPRVTLSSHYLSGESIYFQYSYYRYGENMVLAGRWPWGTYIAAGSRYTQNGVYADREPDKHVVKVQAEIVF